MNTRFKKGHIPWIKGKSFKHTEEAKKKISKALKGKPTPWTLKGDKHWNWKGGKTRNKHATYKYRKWRTKVFERDDWTCQTCRSRGVYLEAHHILSWARYPESRFVLENGVTLCKGCHELTDNYKGKEYGKK